MAEGAFVAYYRVSTEKQGRSGLGLDGQKDSVRTFLNGGSWRLVAEFTEVESGKRNDRPELAKALQACRAYGAKLVIAKLDRLSRDAHFLLGLEKAGIDFVCVDMPTANRLTVGIMAMVAEEERRMISARTKAALAAAKARGVQLGGDRGAVLTDEIRALGLAAQSARANRKAADVLSVIVGITREKPNINIAELARALTKMKIPTPSGKSTQWSGAQVRRIINRVRCDPE